MTPEEIAAIPGIETAPLLHEVLLRQPTLYDESRHLLPRQIALEVRFWANCRSDQEREAYEATRRAEQRQQEHPDHPAARFAREWDAFHAAAREERLEPGEWRACTAQLVARHLVGADQALSAAARVLEVLRRYDAASLRLATTDLLYDQATPATSRLAVLDHRTRVQHEARRDTSHAKRTP